MEQKKISWEDLSVQFMVIDEPTQADVDRLATEYPQHEERFRSWAAFMMEPEPQEYPELTPEREAELDAISKRISQQHRDYEDGKTIDADVAVRIFRIEERMRQDQIAI